MCAWQRVCTSVCVCRLIRGVMWRKARIRYMRGGFGSSPQLFAEASQVHLITLIRCNQTTLRAAVWFQTCKDACAGFSTSEFPTHLSYHFRYLYINFRVSRNGPLHHIYIFPFTPVIKLLYLGLSSNGNHWQPRFGSD